MWEDFVLYYPPLSIRAANRWSDYNTVHCAGSNSKEWGAGGYTNEKNGDGADGALARYIRFGR